MEKKVHKNEILEQIAYETCYKIADMLVKKPHSAIDKYKIHLVAYKQTPILLNLLESGVTK